MNELTVFQDNLVGVFRNDAVTTSLQVAEVFHKRHNNILKAIENLVVDLLKNEPMFWLANYQDSYGRNQKLYRMNRDGFSLHVVYSRLADKMAGINKRDLSNAKQLNTLDEVENMIIHVIELGMTRGKQYKEIFQDCKQRLEWWQDCTFRLPPRIR